MGRANARRSCVRKQEAAPRISLSLTGDKVEDLVVTAYQHVGLNCLQ